MKHPLP